MTREPSIVATERHHDDRPCASALPAPALQGREVIQAVMRTAPTRPGVYRMLDEKNTVLYVGKARNVKNRLQSYARAGGHANRIAAMIMLTRAMEIVTTATEAEALLLEANLIKKFKPRFNVVLRDDKSFPHILLTGDHEVAQIVKHRGRRSRKGHYFGPFASAGSVNQTINVLEKAFLLRSCSDTVFKNRTRPCLLHQIKRCSAPCTGKIDPSAYRKQVGQALDFLSGRSQKVKDQLGQAMEAAARRLDFEQAAHYRDRIAALSHITAHQGINPRVLKNADVFALARRGGRLCIQVFFFRSGHNWGNHAYFPRADESHAEAEIFRAFLAQFYDNRGCPRLIILSHAVTSRPLLETALATKFGHKVSIVVPQRGEKKSLVDHALDNAREALGRKMAETATQVRLMAAVAEKFALRHPPRRIEVYDNSHIQGAFSLGAMIVAGPEGLEKAHYRKFNIRSRDIAAGDDYAMMREVLTRRFARLARADGQGRGARARPGVPGGRNQGASRANPSPPRPDLVVVDGGPGQLGVAHDVMSAFDLDTVGLVAIAKGPERAAGREHFHMVGVRPFMLEARDPVLYYMQRLRDEAHRFAIGGHRGRRRKAMVANRLDAVAGIGPRRKKALLHAFGTAREVARASVADLMGVSGIDKALAQVLYDYFHETGR